MHILHRAAGIRLREALPESRILGGDDIRVSSCCSDWRACRPGDLYVALVDQRQDGHFFADRAIKSGATAVLAERPLPLAVPTCIVPDTRDAHGRLCQMLAGQPSEKMRVIGVTGSNGKTTTAALIAAVFAAAQWRTGLTTSLGYFDSVDSVPAQQTTPNAPELASWLSRMLANGCSHAVVELSSHALAQRQVAGVQFDTAVLTNLRRNHLSFHGSVLNYRRAKTRLFAQLKPGGFAVINSDDPASNHLASKLECPVMTVGIRTQAEVTATVLECQKSEQVFLLTAGNQSIPVRTQMIGDHHVSNCLTAAAVGLVFGISLPTVVRGLESLTHVPGRLERIECGQSFGVYVDYARTPDALAVSLRTLRRVTTGRMICVFGAPGHMDRDQRPLLGRVAERGADLSILTNDNPGCEPPLQIAHDIIDGFEQPARAHVLPDRAAAIAWALGKARPGDTVLIAGKGHEDFQIVGRLCHHFDDRQVAQQWLYEHAADGSCAEQHQPTPRLRKYIG